MKPDSVIHLRVPAATKGRWIRASRAAGMRLTEWIEQAVEEYMSNQMAKVAIPDDIEFSDLNLAYDADGHISFDMAVIERICQASNLPVELFTDAPEDNVCGLIVTWYQAHRKSGGDADPVAESLIAEVLAEERSGQTVSHQPGRA